LAAPVARLDNASESGLRRRVKLLGAAGKPGTQKLVRDSLLDGCSFPRRNSSAISFEAGRPKTRRSRTTVLAIPKRADAHVRRALAPTRCRDAAKPKSPPVIHRVFHRGGG
jgi:hypothetical protein